MYIYIALVLFSTIIFGSHICIRDEKINKLSSFIWVLVMSFFVGFQDNLGQDYFAYTELCRKDWVEPKEFFTILVLYPIHNWSFSPFFFFFTYAFLTYFFFSKFVLEYDRNIRFVIVMIMFQCILFFQSFNLIRQMLACTLFLYGSTLYFNEKKGRWIYLIWACLVHETAILALLLMYMSKYVRVSYTLFVVYIVSFIAFLEGGIISILLSALKPVVMLTSYAHYYDVYVSIFDDEKKNFGIIYAISFLFSVFLFLKRKDIINKGYSKILACFFLGQILFNFLSANVTLVRLSYYCYFYLFILYPLSVKILPPSYRAKILLLIYSIFFLSFYKVISDPYCPFVPYKNIYF